MANYVLVHGAWRGGWAWTQVAASLRASGHNVFTPTLSGLGERNSAAVGTVNLSTHIEDVANVLRFQQLDEVILCGHSYGGMVISGVADAMPERIRTLFYLDALIPSDGDSVATLWGPDIFPVLTAAGVARGFGIEPMPVEMFGGKEENYEIIRSLSSPQPVATFLEPIKLRGGLETVKDKRFVLAEKWTDNPFEMFAAIARSANWRVSSFHAGHDFMLDEPLGLARILSADFGLTGQPLNSADRQSAG